MKFNKWTLGLAALGVVSLASAAQAQDTANSVLTALSSTTISGYVDTSVQWNMGTGNLNNPPYSYGGYSKADGFNLNVVQLSIAKPMDESEWAAGYNVDLWFGPDADRLGTSLIGTLGGYYGYGIDSISNFAIRQAYVALRTPVGNGIDWKIGVFDTIVGYESLAAGNNPNFSHSYGFGIEPTTHTGLLGTYRVNDVISFSAGIANTVGPLINEKAHGPNTDQFVGPKAESYKTYMGSVALTAPEDMGWMAGSTLYGGVVNGFSSSAGDNQTSWYVGGTMSTPVTGLKVGATLDYLDIHNWTGAQNGTVWAVALYSSYQATEKLSLHLRGEYVDDRAFYFPNAGPNAEVEIWAVTATAQYDLWKNVLSRIEFRWDHSDNGELFGFNPNASGNQATLKNACVLAANIIYKF